MFARFPNMLQSWRTQHTVLAVTGLCCLIRLWSLCSLPLIVTNDSTWYLRAAQTFYTGDVPTIPTVRTPGYPLFLAGIFYLFGANPVGVLAAQHVLGCLICALITLIACRLAGPLWGLIPGMLCCLDPWLFAYESSALSEVLGIALFITAAAIALCSKNDRWYWPLLLGLILGCTCLVRPAFQSITPFLLLAWVIGHYSSKRRALLAFATAGLGLAVVLGPWLKYNHDRGVNGMASGYNRARWSGLALTGLLDLNYPTDPVLKEAVAAYHGEPVPHYSIYSVIKKAGGWERCDPFFDPWSKASIRGNLKRYARALGWSLAWELNCYPDVGIMAVDEITYAVWRLGQNGSNMQFGSDFRSVGLPDFEMSGSGGGLRRILLWFAAHVIEGIPHIPIFVCALLAAFLALLRRQWALLLVLLGSFAFFASHVALLVPVSRYSLPVLVLWYVTPAILPLQIRQVLRRTRPQPDALPCGASIGATMSDEI